jgi:hypothetical protein
MKTSGLSASPLYYVGVCWMGYDDPQTIRYSTYPPPIVWKNVMGLSTPSWRRAPSPTAQRGFDDLLHRKRAFSHRAMHRNGDGWYLADNLPEYCDAHEPKNRTRRAERGEDWWSWWLRRSRTSQKHIKAADPYGPAASLGLAYTS